MRARRVPRLSAVLALAVAASAALPQPGRAAGVHVSFTPAALAVQPGDTFAVQVQVAPADAPFNAFDLVLAFDPACLAFVPTTPVSAQRGSLMTGACSNTFHAFTPATDQVSASLGLLCNGVTVTGPGVVYTVRFRALEAFGSTTISCAAGTRFYDAGEYVEPLDCQTMTVSAGATAVVGGAGGAGARVGAPAPNPWRGGPVEVPLVLARGARVGMSVVDAAGRVVGRLPVRLLAGGPTVLSWTPPELPAGVYVLRVESDADRPAARRWMVLR